MLATLLVVFVLTPVHDSTFPSPVPFPRQLNETKGYVVCPSDKRFLLLFTFLKKNRKKKIMVS